MKGITIPSNNTPATGDVLGDIRAILAEARVHAAKVVNSDMVAAYWLIGRRIVLEEQRGADKAKYGEQLLQNLSRKLETEYGNGFSYANLRNMRQFYRTYPDEQICYTLCINLPWSHNRLIMRVEDPDVREWYLKETAARQWSVRQLERNIQSFYYQRMLSSADSAMQTSAKEKPMDIRQFVKDPYVLEFVGLPPFPHHREKPLEDAIIDNLQEFMLELGKGFSFVQRQYRISTETNHFYIDLVFYNYLLKCFVLIDLKTTKLTHRDVGQMDMYIRMFDDIKRGKDDNPTIGILLCADKDETIVKYSVLNESKQMFASKYLPYMPSEEEIKREIENSTLRLKDNSTQ